MAGDCDYRPRAYLNRVLDASSSTHSARAVLMVMCWQAEFDRPEVTITKPQIEEMTGLDRRTVMRGLRLLEAEGTITVLAHRLGGRGCAPRYRLCVAKGADNPAKGGHNAHKGGHNAPPSIDSMDSSGAGPGGPSEEKDAAGRGDAGRSVETGKTDQAARTWRREQAEKRRAAQGRRMIRAMDRDRDRDRGAYAPDPDITPEELARRRRLGKAIRIAGSYGAAVDLIGDWDAGRVPEPPDDD